MCKAPPGQPDISCPGRWGDIVAKVRRIIVRRIRTARAGSPSVPGRGQSQRFDRETLRQFNPSVLELGDINGPCREKEAVAAAFDLTGFTNFCNQVDAHLAIPRFLNDFLEWFFSNIRNRLTEDDLGESITLWTGLPMMVKFLGDGLLLLWDSRKMSEEQICRLAATLYQICNDYRADFYPRLSLLVNKPPAILRCGVARGKVYGIGNDREYVGHCINNASRLSRLGSLTFCFPHRGFQVREHMPAEFRQVFVPKYVSIRGVGDNELVWVPREEYNRLPAKNREMFRSLELVG
jgi:class 3 adenylate cyclase